MKTKQIDDGKESKFSFYKLDILTSMCFAKAD